MPHDDDFKCQRFIDTSGVHNVMSRMLDHNTYPWAWSNCSRYFITEFLECVPHLFLPFPLQPSINVAIFVASATVFPENSGQ